MKEIGGFIVKLTKWRSGVVQSLLEYWGSSAYTLALTLERCYACRIYRMCQGWLMARARASAREHAVLSYELF